MQNPWRIALWGTGQVGSALARAILLRGDLVIVAAKVFKPDREGRDLGELIGLNRSLGVTATTSTDAIIATDTDCVLYTPSPLITPEEFLAPLLALLRSGKHVITPATVPDLPGTPSVTTQIEDACRAGNATFHATGLHPGFMIERLALTLARAVNNVDHLRYVQAADLSLAPPTAWGGPAALGFGQTAGDIDIQRPGIAARIAAVSHTVRRAAEALYGVPGETVRIDARASGLAAARPLTLHGLPIEPGQTAVLHLTVEGFVDDWLFFTAEESWYAGPDHAWRGDNLPFGNFHGPLSHTLILSGDPGAFDTQLEFEPVDGLNPFTQITAQILLDAVAAVCASPPGILVSDTRPRYQRDTRLDTPRHATGAAL